MTAGYRNVHLVNPHSDPPELVPAILTRDVSADTIDHIEYVWRAMRQSLARRFQGIDHDHWDWRSKRDAIQQGEMRIVSISCWGSVQGAMAVEQMPKESRLHPTGAPVLYVAYLEVAPWNLMLPGWKPRLSRVGTTLMVEAVRTSREQGWAGRVGLHSLPGASAFYRKLGMTKLRGSRSPDLPYFEYDEVQALTLLEKAGLE